MKYILCYINIRILEKMVKKRTAAQMARYKRTRGRCPQVDGVFNPEGAKGREKWLKFLKKEHKGIYEGTRGKPIKRKVADKLWTKYAKLYKDEAKADMLKKDIRAYTQRTNQWAWDPSLMDYPGLDMPKKPRKKRSPKVKREVNWLDKDIKHLREAIKTKKAGIKTKTSKKKNGDTTVTITVPK